MIEWDAPSARPRAVPPYTARAVSPFALRHNLPPDALDELFGAGPRRWSVTSKGWRDQVEDG